MRRHSPLLSTTSAASPNTSWVTCSARTRGWDKTGAMAAREIAAGIGRSRTLGGRGAPGALPAEGHPAERADNTDERSAVAAGIPLRGALLLSTGAAGHPVVFLSLG